MFDIVIIDSDDDVVKQAVNTIIGRKARIAAPIDGYRFIANNAMRTEGNGGGTGTSWRSSDTPTPIR